ncbi:hypothetical protein HPB47_028286 [Ixodes persulcatus]|uniref:Uncharacterized protein n=1 Tax=Ixodes persulcatus TaxID=34615 RepID=A0AC60PV55_IXOPE|nr:hypothetical protein HPB47_028286 [Ixodes persulcatus]
MAAMASASVGIAGTADPGSSAPPWSISLTTIPRSFSEHKIEAYRASRLTSSRQDARSHKFLTEAYVEPSSVRVSNRMASIQVLGENLFSCQASPFAKRLRRATTADPVETKFGLAAVGSLLSYQQSLVPFGYDTFISPEVSHVQERNRVLPCEPAFFDSCVSWNMSGLNLPVEQDLLLKRNTRQQSKSPLWKAARQSRLTASSFGDAATRESWTLKGLINLTAPKDISHSCGRSQEKRSSRD